jgi:hypothetical protein
MPACLHGSLLDGSADTTSLHTCARSSSLATARSRACSSISWRLLASPAVAGACKLASICASSAASLPASAWRRASRSSRPRHSTERGVLRTNAASCALSLLLFSQVASPRSRWSTYSRWSAHRCLARWLLKRQLIRRHEPEEREGCLQMVTTHQHAYLHSLLPLRCQGVQLLLTNFTTSALQIGRHPL